MWKPIVLLFFCCNLLITPSLGAAADNAATGANTVEYELPREKCIEIMGENTTVIFTANPGTGYGGKGEDYLLVGKLVDRRNITFPQCWSAYSGFLSGNNVLIVTTGQGPQASQGCVADVLRCSSVIKEAIYFGTAGFSPRQGGILNPPKCEIPSTPGTLTRPGDICITKTAINFDCQSAPWANVSANWPDLCTLPGDPTSPFNPELLDQEGVAGYRGWGCFTTPNEGNSPLVEELEDLATSAVANAVPDEIVQLYTQYWWGNQSASFGVDWMPNKTAPPHIFRHNECSEVSSVYWWQGAPFDALVRKMVGIAAANDVNAPTVAASAMESIGFLSSLERASNLTSKEIPYAIIRASSNMDMQPVIRASNGTFLQGPSIVVPVEGGAEAALAPGAFHAIESGTALIMGLMNKRCTEKGNSIEECTANKVKTPKRGISAPPSPSAVPTPAASSSGTTTNTMIASYVGMRGWIIAVFITIWGLFF